VITERGSEVINHQSTGKNEQKVAGVVDNKLVRRINQVGGPLMAKYVE